MNIDLKKKGIGAGLTVLFISLVILFLSKEEIQVKMFVLSLILGLCVFLFYLIIKQRRRLKIDEECHSLFVDLNERETLILEGPSLIVNSSSSQKGKLFLTNQRLIFISDDSSIRQSLTLSAGVNVELKKQLGLITRQLNVMNGNQGQKFEVEYANDWKTLIKDQIEVNRNKAMEVA